MLGAQIFKVFIYKFVFMTGDTFGLAVDWLQQYRHCYVARVMFGWKTANKSAWQKALNLGSV
jgi:hypothetical protein